MSVAAGEIGTQQRPLYGIALKVISVTVFVVMSSLIKAAGTLPPGQIVFSGPSSRSSRS